MAINPDYGYLADRLRIVVSGLRSDLGPRPTVYFSLLTPLPGPAEVTVTPGSVHQTGAGQYEFEMAIALGARPRTYTVVLTRQPGWSEAAGSFTVRGGIRLTRGLPNRHGLTLSLPAPVPAPAPAPGAAPSPASAPPATTPSDALRRILDAEAEILTVLARAAVHHIHCPEWLAAAAKKECCAAKVLEAVATLRGQEKAP